MKNFQLLLILFAAFTMLCTNAEAQKNKKLKLKNFNDSSSYALGVSIGKSLSSDFKKNEINANYDIFLKGFKSAIMDTNSIKLTDKQITDLMIAFQNNMRNKSEEKQKKFAEENKKKGQAFLEENKKKNGVFTTASGLQFVIVEEGTGKKPVETDTVTVNYTGKLIDGKIFDSSIDRGQPATFPLNAVIPGWIEGLQLMKEGAKYVFFIPSELAYGDYSPGEVIPPGSTLIFEVELISVKKAESEKK